MKILLTGATGFLGSAILKALLKNDHEVIIIKRSFSDIHRISQEIKETKVYDIDQKGSLEKIFGENKNIATVLHTATCYGKKNETEHEITDSNIAFPVELINLAIENNVKTFINTSSFFQKITDKEHPLYTYIESKRKFKKIGKKLATEKKIHFIDAKIQHLYGTNDDESKFIPFIIHNSLHNTPLLNLTKGEQERDFIYIDDAVDAYLKIISFQECNYYVSYEIGTGQTISIKQAVESIAKIVSSKTEFRFGKLPYRAGEVMSAKADISKLLKLGWKPEYDFDKGIKEILSLEYNGEIK